MTERKKTLTNFTEEQRNEATEKYKIIEPYIKNQKELTNVSRETGIPLRTLYRWSKQYNTLGLVGLIRKNRSDNGTVRISNETQQLIEQLYLSNKKMSIATIHRKIIKEYKVDSLSYYQVYKVIKTIEPSLVYLAHKGSKKYDETYDLIHIREANRANEIWQADHTLLDIEILDGKNVVNRPWLTIILDEFSRSVVGYNLSFNAPSAIQTSLTLHQAIWQKKDQRWPVCGIPENFYTDHGSDFTSQHLEQVAIDLRINLIFSRIGVPRGRGKIERFFLTVNQLLLESLPGYIGNKNASNLLTIQEFKDKLHYFLIEDYNHKIHSSLNVTPIEKWNSDIFLPNMPDSLETLDMLLLESSKTRKVHSDGIHFQGIRYTNPNLIAYVGESVLIRYNPSDLVEIRIYYKNQFLCNAISPELSSYSVDLQDLVSARNKRKRNLKKQIQSLNSIDILVQEKELNTQQDKQKNKSKLKRYYNE